VPSNAGRLREAWARAEKKKKGRSRRQPPTKKTRADELGRRSHASMKAPGIFTTRDSTAKAGFLFVSFSCLDRSDRPLSGEKTKKKKKPWISVLCVASCGPNAVPHNAKTAVAGWRLPGERKGATVE